MLGNKSLYVLTPLPQNLTNHKKLMKIDRLLSRIHCESTNITDTALHTSYKLNVTISRAHWPPHPGCSTHTSTYNDTSVDQSIPHSDKSRLIPISYTRVSNHAIVPQHQRLRLRSDATCIDPYRPEEHWWSAQTPECSSYEAEQEICW